MKLAILCFSTVLVAAELLVAAPAAFAQSFPAKPIRVIVPLAPGGSAEVGARMVSDKVAQSLGQPVLVESRPGGGGAVGVNYVARSAPDGYTLVVGPAGAMSINVSLAKLPYDPVKDLAPLSGMTRSTLFIVVSPGGEIRSFKELLAVAKARPGTLNYGTPGVATAQHLAGELLNTMAGVNLVHVPFKGSSEAMTAVIGRQIQVAILGPAGIASQVRSGRLQIIASTDTARAAGLAEAPTVAESGIPGYFAGGWLSFFAPAATPGEIVGRLNGEIVRALKLPDVVEKIVAGGEIPDPTTPEELGRFVRAEIDKWAKVIKTSGIRLEQ